MWGNPEHLTEMARKIRGKWSDAKDSLPGEFHVLVATTNMDDYTYDGVDHGGERVAEEVCLPILVLLILRVRLGSSIPLFLARSLKK